MNPFKFLSSVYSTALSSTTSLFAVPWVMSIVMTYCLCKGVLKSEQHYYGARCCWLAVVLTLGWSIAFGVSQYRLLKGAKSRAHFQCPLAIVLMLAYFAATYFVYAVWGGYLSVFPYDALDIGAASEDTLYFSAIAESFGRSVFPSSLLNDEPWLHYHTFSNLLLYVIATIMRMPCFTAYNYVYPVVFLPVYSLSILLAIVEAKKYFANEAVIRFIDYILVVVFWVGVTNNLAPYMANPYMFVKSESFLIANTLVLFALALSFFVLRLCSDHPRLTMLYCAAFIPAAIFIIAWSKVSAGLLFTVGVIYFLVRRRPRKLTTWLLVITYGLIYLICLSLFNDIVVSWHSGARATAAAGEWFPFARLCRGPLRLYGHWLLVSQFAILFVGLALLQNRLLWQEVKTGKTVWVELSIIITLVGFMVQAVPFSGSMVNNTKYFTLGAMLPSLVFLCGHDWLDLAAIPQRSLKLLLCTLACGWCVWVGYHQRTSPFLRSKVCHAPLAYPATWKNHIPLPHDQLTANEFADHIAHRARKRLCKTLFEIRALVGRAPQDYTIYLDQDSVVSSVYAYPSRAGALRAIYVCPALTGVGVINATYSRNGTIYAYTGQEVYGFGVRGGEGPLSYAEALTIAQKRGKKKLIHMTHDGYEVIDLQL